MNWLTAPIIAPLLCGMMLIIALMRVTVPIGQPVSGTVIGTVVLGFRERLRLQRINVYLIGVVLILGTIGGWLRAPLNLVVILATFVVVSIPVQYTFTSEGVSRNRVVFRRWAEFTGVREDTGRLMLLGTDGAADFPLLLAPNQHEAAKRLLAASGIDDSGPIARSTKIHTAAVIGKAVRKGAVSSGR